MNNIFTNAESILIVSPHLDDACYSLGGALYKLQALKVIWDIYSQSTFTNQKYLILIGDREKEEEEFCAKICAKSILSNLPDAHSRGYTHVSEYLNSSIENIINDDSREDVKSLVKNYKTIKYKYNPTIIGIPMASGCHMDHLKVRELMINYVLNYETDKAIFFFYEDLPYSSNSKWLEKELNYLANYFVLRPIRIDISDVIEEKFKLLKIYNSQISQRDIDQIISYSKSFEEGKNYEQIWIAYKK